LIHFITVTSSNASDVFETYDVSRGQPAQKTSGTARAGERGKPVVCPPLGSWQKIKKEGNAVR
jgi:hypothetical protein